MSPPGSAASWRVVLGLLSLQAFMVCSARAQPAPPARRDAGAAMRRDAGATAGRDAAPPDRPSEESVQAAARTLFQAIVQDQPALAEPVFFPRAAFVQVKAMHKPERYWDKLHARFAEDIHRLHHELQGLGEASFVKLALGRRGGWVRSGEEGNRLPYWAARHAFLHYQVGARVRTLEVRVLITWANQWYVIHLREFH